MSSKIKLAGGLIFILLMIALSVLAGEGMETYFPVVMDGPYYLIKCDCTPLPIRPTYTPEPPPGPPLVVQTYTPEEWLQWIK